MTVIKPAALNLSDTAVKMIRADVRADGARKVRFADYVTETGVTVETIPAHVTAFKAAYVKSNPTADTYAVKVYTMGVRQGLKTALSVPRAAARKAATALVTSLGADATAREVLIAWKAMQK